MANTQRDNASGSSTKNRPRFLWDYELNDAQVKEILGQPGLSPMKRWLVERILCEARFEEIFEYLDLKSLQRYFPQLKLPSRVQQQWQYALDYWGRDG